MMSSLAWMLSPVSGASEARTVHGALSQLAAEFCSRFGFTQSEDVILETPSWKLCFGDPQAENSISSVDLQAAGEITRDCGYEPILFLAAVRRRIKEVHPGLERLISFSDEDGKEVALDRWSDLVVQMQRIGFPASEIAWTHKQAQAINFADTPFFSNVNGKSSTFF